MGLPTRIKTKLVDKGLVHCIEDGSRVREVDCMKSLCIIWSMLDDADLEAVKHAKTVPETWRLLEERYSERKMERLTCFAAVAKQEKESDTGGKGCHQWTTIECFYCKRTGHRAKNCWKKHQAKHRKRSMQSVTGEVKKKVMTWKVSEKAVVHSSL